MELARQILNEGWEHDEGDHRIEDMCARDQGLSERMAQIALRFISAKGLSTEFADVLEQIDDIENRADVPPTP